jgi:hypothetical protein
MTVMNNLIENNIYETGESFCNITLKLSKNVLTQRRTYLKLLDILGNIGGFMEIIFTLLKVISSFSTKIIYQESLVNNLFEFNLNKKIILINNKERNYLQKNNFSFKKIPKQNFLTKHIISSENVFIDKEDKMNQSKNQLNIDISNITKMNNESLLIIKSQNRNNGNNLSIEKEENKNNIKNIDENYSKKNKIRFYSKSDKKIISSLMENENGDKKTILISEIKINRTCLYICFFYVRKRKNLQNVLLNEGMKLIFEKLDLLNIFRTVYRDEKIHLKIKNDDLIKMSNNCRKNLEGINN